jgi:hypothetical protein
MKNRLLILIPILSMFASCTDDITGLNTDTKRPTMTDATYLFTNAEHALVDQVTSTSVNVNVFRLYAQQWTEVQYPQESQYDFSRNIPDTHWNVYYRDVLRDFKEAKSLLTQLKADANAEEAAIIDNKIAVIDILSAYAYNTLVDTFGDIPYTQALDISGNPLPKYDDAETIYRDLLAKLDAASDALDTSVESFGAADLIYGGNTGKWAKFANSLRLRMAINMHDVDATYASAQVLAAEADGLMTSSADGTYMTYAETQPNANPLYVDLVASGRNDFLPADTFVNKMNALGDPRRPKYFTLYDDGTYKGGVYGALNTYGSFSHLTETIKEPTYPGVLFTYSEVEFLLAEAAARGIAVSGSAASHYNAAITASMQDWGVASADIVAYLGRPDVAYATAAPTWQEKIGEQAWISYFNRGFEAWTSYRRLDYPVLAAPAITFNNLKEVPKSYPYPVKEQTINATNVQAAIAKSGGTNIGITKVFWDKK